MPLVNHANPYHTDRAAWEACVATIAGRLTPTPCPGEGGPAPLSYLDDYYDPRTVPLSGAVQPDDPDRFHYMRVRRWNKAVAHQRALERRALRAAGLIAYAPKNPPPTGRPRGRPAGTPNPPAPAPVQGMSLSDVSAFLLDALRTPGHPLRFAIIDAVRESGILHLAPGDTTLPAPVLADNLDATSPTVGRLLELDPADPETARRLARRARIQMAQDYHRTRGAPLP